MCTYLVPLQEDQRPAPVLTQQLLSALLQGQLRLSDLLALHRTPALSNGLHHVINTGSLSPAHTLGKIPEGVGKRSEYAVRSYVSVTVELTGASGRCCRGSIGSLMVYFRYDVSAMTGKSNLPPSFSSSIKVGWVFTGSSISPHIIVTSRLSL